jgi:hypothetical protein
VAVTVDSFQQTFSEFRKTDRGEIEAKLKLARLEVASDIWGSRADAGVLYMTAHLLALAPAGQNAKLKPQNAAQTVYLQHFDRMKRAVAFGRRTAGLGDTSGAD